MSKEVLQFGQRDYWLDEWPLAFSLGRNFLRVHGNSIDPSKPNNYRTPETLMEFRLTDGCVNTGSKQGELIRILMDMGLLIESQLTPRDETAPASMTWSVSSKLGKAFLIVKDYP